MTSANITLIAAWQGKFDVGIFRAANNDLWLDSASTYSQFLMFRIINEVGFAEKLLDLQGKTIACMCDELETCHGNKLIKAVDWINEHGGAEAVRGLECPPFRNVFPMKFPNGKPHPQAGEQIANSTHPRVAGWLVAAGTAAEEAPF